MVRSDKENIRLMDKILKKNKKRKRSRKEEIALMDKILKKNKK